MLLKEALKKSFIFSRLGDEELKELEALIHIFHFSKGEVVFHHGDSPADLHFLIEGQLKSVRYTKSGKETTLHMIAPGELCAVIPAYLDIPYTGSAVALKKSSVGKIKRKEFLQLVSRFPDIGLKMMGMMALRAKELLTRIEDQTTLPPLERLARFLLREKNSRQSESFDLPMSKADLARILGTVPETLSRGLTELTQKGIIQLEGKKVRVLDGDALEVISEKEG